MHCTIPVDFHFLSIHPIYVTQLKATFWPKLNFHNSLSDMSLSILAYSVSLVHRMKLAISQLRTMRPSYTKVIKNPTRTTLNQSSSISFFVFIQEVQTQTIQMLQVWTVIHFLTISPTRVLIGTKTLSINFFFILRIIFKWQPSIAFLCDAW